MLLFAFSFCLLLSHFTFRVNGANAPVLRHRTAGNEIVVLEAPTSPSPERQVVDAQFVSYSIEFPNWPDYAGNLSSAIPAGSDGRLNSLTNISVTRTIFRFNSSIT